MLSLTELRHVAQVIERRLAGARIERVVQPEPEVLVFTLYGRSEGEEKGSKHFLLMSCHSPHRESRCIQE